MLLDTFKENGIDHETISFLVEALSNADTCDWHAILEPFVHPSPVLSVIEQNPGILEHTVVLCHTDMARMPEAKEHNVTDARDDFHGMSSHCVQYLMQPHEMTEVKAGLSDAGFTVLGENVFSHVASGITVETVSDALPDVAVDGCSKDQIVNFVAKAFACEGPHGFGNALLSWGRHIQGKKNQIRTDFQYDTCSSSEDSGAEFDSDGFDPRCIPSATELGANPGRRLTIFTWGFFKLSRPPDAQVLINCSSKKFHYLTRNNKHIKKLNGLHDVVQGRICRNTYFEPWLRDTIRRIESVNLASISLCDAKGTHLVVAIAEIIQKTYYPRAQVQHLTLTANKPGHAGGPRRH